ncbi:MAG: FlgD Ig-like domain [Verrucomicrobiota bacterium]
MRIADCGMRNAALAAALGAIFFAHRAAAQESPSPSPSPTEARSVRVSFVPPPIEGTISLGIYDAKGKLVRVLFREADINEFTIGNDSLSTTWDGKDDAGESVPPGKYSAHGFVVGDLKIEGVGFFFNDWVTKDDSPRITRVDNVRDMGGKLLLLVSLPGDQGATVTCDLSGKILDFTLEGPGHFTEAFEPGRAAVRIENGKLLVNQADGWKPVSWSTLIKPEHAAMGSGGSIWVIDRIAENDTALEVKQFAANGEFLRRLAYQRGDPQPKVIAGSNREEKIFVLEEGSALQRLRGLSLVLTKAEGGQQPTSDWKVDFEKGIVAHKDFSLVDGKPVPSPTAGANAPEKLKIKLQPNPLVNDERVTVELAIGFDEDGSFLKASDGLPLFSISETPKLIRGLLALHSSNAIDVFQDDGAVVEQFRLSGVDQMMSFDCGGFELK